MYLRSEFIVLGLSLALAFVEGNTIPRAGSEVQGSRIHARDLPVSSYGGQPENAIIKEKRATPEKSPYAADLPKSYKALDDKLTATQRESINAAMVEAEKEDYTKAVNIFMEKNPSISQNPISRMIIKTYETSPAKFYEGLVGFFT